MSIIGFVPEPGAALAVVDWAKALSRDGDTVRYVCMAADDGERVLRDVLAERGISDPSIEVFGHTTPVKAALARCKADKAHRLVTAAFSMPTRNDPTQNSEVLVRGAPCESFCTLFGDKRPGEVKKILALATGSAHDRAVVRTAEHLSRGGRAQVTVATVEDESSDRAEQAGELAVQALLHDVALQDDDRFEIKVVVDRLPHRGVKKCVDGHDLILVGREDADLVRPLRETLSETTVAVVKRDPPLRLRALPDWLPRINPSDHAELLQDLRYGSLFNPDFAGMLGLAAAIAALGLIQNSPAVVIGSMLLAPLMTPMIGLGLSVAQANARLGKTSARSIALGFLLTMAVSFLVALATPMSDTLSPETLARGGPNVLDLLIAVFAGIAATFAMARPNISGAVAGVAIATALVPPVCALGVSLEIGDYENSVGAGVLFLTNMIAIVVASAVTFLLLGVTPQRALPRHRRTARVILIGLMGLLVFLAGPLAYQLTRQIDVGRSEALTFPVTREVSKAVFAFVAEDDDVDVTFLARSSVRDAVFVHIGSRRELPIAYSEKLRALVRKVRNDPDLQVIVIAFQGMWRSEHSEVDLEPGEPAPGPAPSR